MSDIRKLLHYYYKGLLLNRLLVAGMAILAGLRSSIAVLILRAPKLCNLP